MRLLCETNLDDHTMTLGKSRIVQNAVGKEST